MREGHVVRVTLNPTSQTVTPNKHGGRALLHVLVPAAGGAGARKCDRSAREKTVGGDISTRREASSQV